MKGHITLFFALCLLSSIAFATDRYSSMRAKFLEAEQSIKENDEAKFLAQVKQLRTYPLTPYLYYQWLTKKMELNKTVTEKEVKTFLNTYQDFPLQKTFTRKWIAYLSKQGKSDMVLFYYPKDNTNDEMTCAYLYAKYDVYQDIKTLAQATELWLVAHSQPKSCDLLFEKMEKKGILTQDLIWQRFIMAIENRKLKLAKYLLKKLDKQYSVVGKTTLLLAENPKRLSKVKPKNHPLYSDLFTANLTLLASRDLKLTKSLWDKAQRTITFTQEQKDKVHHKIGMSLAHKHQLEAINWLKKVNDKPLLTKHWQIRLSIRNERWRDAVNYIDTLDPHERSSSRWRYWLARSLDELGQKKVAKEMYSILSKERNYYGFLSAKNLNQQITLKNFPIRIKQNEIDKFGDLPQIKRIKEWRKLKRTWMERIEWRFVLKSLPELQKLAAAKYAHNQGWLELGILAMSTAEFKNDLPIRFPFAHQNVIKRHAQKTDLNPDWIFALTRQESAFYAGAVSSVGARGLMQLMPTTATYVANMNNIRISSKWALHQPDTNVQLGTLYLKHLLKRFDNHPILATASYNAGPSRIIRWLPHQSMDADIWIESMPFQETRDYVKNIVTYSQIYRALEGKHHNLNEMMPTVQKKS